MIQFIFMLEKLFGSKVGVKILSEMGKNPYKEFYLNELSKNLKIGLGRTKTILDNLVDLNILKKRKSGNRFFLKLNENNPLSFEIIKFANLDALTKLDDDFRYAITNFSNAYENILGDNLLSIIVFGSIAKEEATRCSDIDILVIVKEQPKKGIKEELRRYFSSILDIFSKITEEKIFTEKEFEEKYENGDDFLINIMKDGIIVFDRNFFYSKILLRGLPVITKKTIKIKLDAVKETLDYSLEVYKKHPELIAPGLGIISNHLSRSVLLLNGILPESKHEICDQLKNIKENRLARTYKKTRIWFDNPPLEVNKDDVWDMLNFLKEKYNECYRMLERWM